MKKIFIIILIIIGIAFLYFFKTSKTQNNQSNFYNNPKLGIKFDYSGDEFKDKLKTKNNQIYYQYEGTDNISFIEIYSKKPDQTIEKAILDIVKSKGKNPTNCKIKNVTDPVIHPNYSLYIIDLANPNITYTKDEIEKIKQGKNSEEATDISEMIDIIKQEIYNNHLIESCSEYADPLGLATSRTTPSRFLFDNKKKFVFLPGSADPLFYQEPTIELFE